MLKNIKIFPKILLNCLLIALIPLIGLIYHVEISEQEQKSVVEKSLRQSSDVLVSEVNNWVDKNIKNTSLLAKMDEFRNMQADQQVSKLIAAQKNLDWVSLIFVADTNGDAVARSDGGPIKNYSDREYFQEVLSGKEIGQQVLIGKVKPVPLHCFAIPVDSMLGQLAGVITQCSTLASIADHITETRIGETGFAFLVDDKNRLIAHGEDSGKLVGKLQDFSFHPALAMEDKSVKIEKYEDKERVFTSRSLGLGWRLVVQQDYEEAYENYLSAKDSAFILVVLTVIVTFSLSFAISYSISSSVKALTEIVDSYSKGVFDKKILGQERGDELGELARAVSRMAKTIQIAITRLRKQKSSV